MGSFGRQVLPNKVGTSIQFSGDGRPLMKPIGVTIDWATVPAVNADTTWLDGVFLANGKKGLRYGQPISMITASGKFGPFDSSASDGREIILEGRIYVVNQSFLQDDPLSDHPPAMYGGVCWMERAIVGGTNQITRAQLLGVLKQLQPVTSS